MKRRDTSIAGQDQHDALDELASALAGLRDAADVRDFLLDLCTPAELEAMTDRWKVVPLLLERIPYREIHERTGVSVTTVGRVARTIEYGAGGYATAMHRLHRHRA